MVKIDEQFMRSVLNIVDIIPFGRVATYGQIAKIIGRPRNARLVGKALGKSFSYGKHPCHRVVTATGRLVPGWIDQRPMLMAEGVPFKDENHVDIKQCQWQWQGI
ncbi:methylated-DNA--[protein]-cysteine S-methyltransferase [Limosilactobacillus sp. Sa3CUN2]|uniref:Methylated-DNA--[protein]-cysteine S-methyltransferase n=1 Tax=Limosilactobacillus avistercoris TaxID=2762243 RepID=A0ABR8PDN7_9LACO|nr:methylated-DNA--[protein]-cysteine S-methyltransferase [Limosilactobacillus avistercoris]MBD7895405.1 methylated-DNA--[protein]-cysteine S-methyltransferase [Limosilactobacillus avistercoris]